MSGAHAGSSAGNIEHCFAQRSFAGAVLADQDDITHLFSSWSCHCDHQLSLRPRVRQQRKPLESCTNIGKRLMRRGFPIRIRETLGVSVSPFTEARAE